MWNKLNNSMMFCQMLFGLSYYGVMAVLTRFFMDEFGYSEARTIMIVGAFSAIAPLFAVVGGFVADKFLGAYRTLTVSCVGSALGYLCLFLGATTCSVSLAMTGIALASYSRGLMSPYSSLFKRTFRTSEDFENGYPVNYSVNNIGAFLGMYCFPLLIIVTGFQGSFILSALLTALSLGTLLFMRGGLRSVAAKLDQSPVSLGHWMGFFVLSFAMIGLVFFMFSNMDVGQIIVYAIGGAAILHFISLMFKASRAEQLKMGTILIMMFLTTCFFIYYSQIMTSMNIVAINTMRGEIFGLIPMSPEASMSLNPFWCMVAGPVITLAFSMLEKRGVHFSTASKVGIAFILTVFAFGVLTWAVSTVGADAIIRPEIFLVVHFFQAFAEVIVGAMVVAFILSVAPKRIENFSVSMFSVAIALSGIIGAVFSTTIALEEGQQITQEIVQNIYGDYYKLLTMLAVVMVGVAFGSSFVIRKMLTAAKVHEDATEAEG